jgi:hypothetical protein
VPPASSLWLDVTRTVPLVHFIQPFAKSAERHRHFDNVGNFALDCLCVGAAFVA